MTNSGDGCDVVVGVYGVDCVAVVRGGCGGADCVVDVAGVDVVVGGGCVALGVKVVVEYDDAYGVVAVVDDDVVVV